MKHMKKSMFITTLAMVVVLVVALSTATFAWYTANTQVTVNSTIVTSAASSAASLAIDKANNLASSNSSVTITMNGNLMPMIPSAKPVATGTPTTYTAFTTTEPSAYFNQAPVNNAGNFTQNGNRTSPATIGSVKNATGDASSVTSFYVINTDATNETNVNAAITISTTAYTLLKAKPDGWDTDNTSYFKISEGAYVACTGSDAWAASTYYRANASVYEDLRVALFVDGNYVSTWSYSGDNCYYGTITNGANGSSSLSHDYTTLASSIPQTIGSIAAVSSKQIQIVAWFDGVELEVDEASSAVFFTINFTVA